jgi:hypothetical protein
MIGYILRRKLCGRWIFIGTTPEDVAIGVRNEIDSHEGLSLDECDVLIIEPREISQDEIDNMPEFDGW